MRIKCNFNALKQIFKELHCAVPIIFIQFTDVQHCLSMGKDQMLAGGIMRNINEVSTEVSSIKVDDVAKHKKKS